MDSLDELPAKGGRCRDAGAQHEDRLGDQARIDRTLEASACRCTRNGPPPNHTISTAAGARINPETTRNQRLLQSNRLARGIPGQQRSLAAIQPPARRRQPRGRSDARATGTPGSPPAGARGRSPASGRPGRSARRRRIPTAGSSTAGAS